MIGLFGLYKQEFSMMNMLNEQENKTVDWINTFEFKLLRVRPTLK